ncbi:hypothetical protein BMS3Abin10_01748 [bacterium BMS3Abin10]|nr:hypothetical protein BMS3Abin10_01748 [bacterium BMS3Abin10]GBE39107.1 hypothetical protein BMS3Bbin08_01725 [bacterium BMS3Bbin08]
MKKTVFLLIISLIIFFAGIVDAGNFGIGVHSGYGVIKYEEQSSAFGNKFESASTQDMVIFGVSGEYSFPGTQNFYANITTDWVFGLEGVEIWKENNIQIQTTDISVFFQFYDFRFGYKNARDNLYYSFYVSGGLDGMHFKRDKFLWRGTPVTGSITEDIYLWRTGMGTGVGYKAGKWALDGRFAYACYPVVKVNNSSLPQFTFNTNGAVLDTGLGLSREVAENVNFYFGGSYSLLKLEQSDIMQKGSIQAVYPGSKTEIMAGMVNLTFGF